MAHNDSSDDSSDELLYKFYIRKRNAYRRRYWVHPRSFNNRLFVAAREMDIPDSKFLCFYRMSKHTYRELVRLISPTIRRKNTQFRECVDAEERIMITLRYLGTGSTFASIALYFARGESTVSGIVIETSKVMWEVLKGQYMRIPDRFEWKRIAERFDTLWNLPNCLGAIDGNHVRIEKLPNSGSTNYNYKSYHSIVLLACCDADGHFTMIETGYAGRNSDGGIFQSSAIKYWILNGELDIPSPSALRYDENKIPFPYYFVGDEAFPLLRFLMRPYPRRVLNNARRIFNYRLSRGRKTVECAFGMACEKFAVLNGPIRIRKLENINSVIKAACILYNFVRKNEGIHYTPTHNSDDESSQQNRVEPLPETSNIDNNAPAHVLRNFLANYFITPRASLPWQWKYAIP